MDSKIIQNTGHFKEKFNVISKLGEGGFATVFEVKRKAPNSTRVLEIIPVSDESDEQEKIIETCVIHMKEKYQHRVCVRCWKERLSVDVITSSICVETVKDEDKEDSASSTQVTSFESQFAQLLNQKLSQMNNDTDHHMMQMYLFVDILLSEGVRVEDWIDIGKVNEQFKIDFSDSSSPSRSMFQLLPGQININNELLKKQTKIICKPDDGAFGTLLQFKFTDTTSSYAVKIIALPPDVVEQDKYIRECSALHKMTKWGEGAIFCTDIIESWSENLPMDFISSIWPDEEEAEEEEEEEGEEGEEDNKSDSQLGSIQKDKENIKQDNEYLFILMKMYGSQTLRDWMRMQNNQVGEWEELCFIYTQILIAVFNIHANELIHRDLKPENIFYDADGGFVFVGDFGLATSMHNAQSHIDPNRVKGGKYEHTKHVGTTTYMSPEQLEGKEYNHKVDVYALGIILFELLVPFGSAHERSVTLANLRKGMFPANFQSEHPKEYDLIKSMLSSDPNERPEIAVFLDTFYGQLCDGSFFGDSQDR